ncbi:MAG: SepM family pheromone-processing serine protease [Heyndrickxia sp.]
MMKRKLRYPVTLIIVILLLALFFYRLPFYIEKPGMAHELESIVKVQGGYDEKGKLMLTTVQLGKANIYDYLLAKIKKYDEIVSVNEIKDQNQTDEEYNVYQLYLMESSKHNAIQIAYKKAKKPYHFVYKGVYVLDIYPKMPAAKVFKPGDRIVRVDNHTFTSSEQFIHYIAEKRAGDVVRVGYIRNNEEKTNSIKLTSFKAAGGKIGMGIGLVDNRELIAKPKVSLQTDNIGGPSAGLMFSLEIYNQLTKQDITKGYSIAGTGTIDPEGKVGRIGGIDKKVVAASREGADIFFAPDDEITPEMKKAVPNIKSNYREALAAAKDIGTKMKIVPVKSFDDAVSYLQKLKNR